MKFELDFLVLVGDEEIASRDLLAKLDRYRDPLKKDLAHVEGSVLLRVDGDNVGGEYSDPLFRLVGQWVRKVPWILTGDTETVALRNSEHCFAFVPAGDSVELSFFLGSESEIDEYVTEPMTVRLDTFATQSIDMAERLLQLASGVDRSVVDTEEDCRDLAASLDEAKRAWRDHRLHNRR